MVSSDLDVVTRLNGTLYEVFQRGQSPDSLVTRRVFGRDFPNSDLPILVTRIDLLPGYDYSLDQPAIRLEPGILPLVFPDPDVLGVGASVQQVARGGQRVYVAFFSDERAHEDVGEVVVWGHVRGPG
ncbi:hypothetical protein TorRG33x02_016370 [Trema orientale]|uniref:Uncharacterized protein n=1 Tax=Trema orientale TaxID=63057 RepID=A0A2P5FXX5_TREOI|nr:hypothetical protein TorRG33x02_016370 [Trema orientale]